MAYNKLFLSPSLCELQSLVTCARGEAAESFPPLEALLAARAGPGPPLLFTPAPALCADSPGDQDSFPDHETHVYCLQINIVCRFFSC